MSAAEDRTLTIIKAYCEDLPKEVGRMTDLLEASQQPGLDTVTILRDMRYEAHRMSGSAICMGFPFIGDTFASIEADLSTAVSQRGRMPKETSIHIALQLQSIARLIAHTRPENSKLLRQLRGEVPDVGLRKAGEDDVLLATQTVVFADDDAATRHLMETILSVLGLARYGVYATGDELLREVRLLQPDIVITDWMMKSGDGMDIMHAVRSGKAGIDRRTSVMFLTSLKSVEKVNEAIRAGVDDFLVKPFTFNMVRKCILRAAQLKHARLQKEPEPPTPIRSDGWSL